MNIPPVATIVAALAIAHGLTPAPLRAATPPTTLLGAEWLVPAPTGTPGFSLVDVESGAIRIGTMNNTTGTVAWPHHLATGIPSVSDVASGQVIAITSPVANRVVLIDPGSPAPYPKIISSLAGIGSSAVAPSGSRTSPDLLIASSENGPTTGLIETRGKPEEDAPLIAQSDHPDVAFHRAQPIFGPSDATALALLTSVAPNGSTHAWLAQRRDKTHLFEFLAEFPANHDFATAIISNHHPGVPFAIAHTPGSSEAFLVSFSTPFEITSSATVSPITLPYDTASIIPVAAPGVGPIDQGFFALSADGKVAEWFRITPDGDDIEFARQAFGRVPGTSLTGIALIPGVGIVQLNAPAPGMPATTFNAFLWDGSNWQETDAGDMPDSALAADSPASVLFYNDNPFIEPNARLLGIQSIRDWTSLSAPPDGVPTSVTREVFTSATAGLIASGTTSIVPPPETKHVVPNQPTPALSITALGPISQVFARSLQISPPSGTYDHTFQVTAAYDATRHRLRYRRDGGPWLTFHNTVPVAWSTTLQFMLQEKSSSTNGPIITRTYTLPPEDIADIDSDGDGVPDYVELHFGLDPFAGADSDGDGFSDLDEILQGNNPADPLDFPQKSLALAASGGMRVVATATDFAAREIADAEDISAHAAADGALLARAPVAPVSPALPDGSSRGARLTSASPPPLDELITISTPLYFDNQSTGARTGREIIGFVPSDPPPLPSTDFTPAPGMSLEQAATGWVDATVAALQDTPVTAARVTLTPASAAASVLLEEITHAAAASLRPAGDPMPALSQFTLLNARVADAARATLTPSDRANLKAAGFSHRLALAIAADAMPDLQAVADAIYQRHTGASASNPGMLLPIDALRLILRGASLPAGYTGAVPAATLNAARTAYQDALAASSAAFRPITTWVVEIPATPLAAGIYTRLADDAAVALLRPNGDRFLLNRGLGLQPGSQFTVVGFTDTPPASGFPTMEVATAALTFEPAPGDADQDGNLLDDEWERFFFGSTGQDPFSQPHGGGYALLQYFLDGIDPRTGVRPSGPPADLRPQLPIFNPAGEGSYTLDFLFPAAYRDRFAFVLERSETLAPGSFAPVPDVSITPIGGDEFRVHIPQQQAPPGKAFFRVRLALVP